MFGFFWAFARYEFKMVITSFADSKKELIAKQLGKLHGIFQQIQNRMAGRHHLGAGQRAHIRFLPRSNDIQEKDILPTIIAGRKEKG